MALLRVGGDVDARLHCLPGQTIATTVRPLRILSQRKEAGRTIAGVKLPADSVISERKIREYLLTPRLEDDKSRFLALAGYSLSNWYQLETDLRRQIEEGDALLIRTTP